MKIRITARDGIVRHISLDVSGFRVEVSDLEAERTLVITEEGGSVCVSVPSVAADADVSGTEASITKEDTLPPKPEAALLPTIAPPKAEPQEVVSASEAEKPSADALFSKLSVLRKQIATEAKLPAYTVFQDKSLHAMCEALPQDVQALRSIPGVGEARLAKYGSAFIEVIKQYLSEEVAA